MQVDEPPPAYVELSNLDRGKRGRLRSGSGLSSGDEVVVGTPVDDAAALDPLSFVHVHGQRVDDRRGNKSGTYVTGEMTTDEGTDESCTSAADTSEADTDDAIDAMGRTEEEEEAFRRRERRRKKKKKKKKIYWIKHRVQPEDTLAGLCLRYNCRPSMLKRVNNFTANHFWTKEFLLVPTTDPSLGRKEDAVELSPEQQALRKVHRERKLEVTMMQICPELKDTEVRSYLKLHNYSIKKALMALKDDKKWEANGCAVKIPTVEDLLPPNFRR